MTLRPGEVPGRAIAVFPFLKTRDPITLGDFTFRSKDDTSGLDAEDVAHVREIADMIYLQDDLRIRSAAYAILPAIDLDKNEAESAVAELERIQAVVAFCYSHSHRTFGKKFFSFEQAQSCDPQSGAGLHIYGPSGALRGGDEDAGSAEGG